MYYLDNIKGDYQRQNYRVILQNNKLVAVDGTLDLLADVLTIIKSKTTTNPCIVIYEKLHPRYMTEALHSWIKL